MQHDGGYRNKNNMTFKRSSNSVQFLQTPDASGGTGIETLFDTASMRPTSDTPVFKQIKDNRDEALTDYTLVRIPKGQSLTVTYSLKDGSAYNQDKLNELGIRFFEKRLVELGDSVKLTRSDAKDVKAINMTITNDGAVGNGDIIVGVRNNLMTPFYIGVANGTRANPKPWETIANNPVMAFSYHIDTEFKGTAGLALSPAIKQYDVTSTPHLYHGMVMGSDIHIQNEDHYSGFTGSYNSSYRKALSK